MPVRRRERARRVDRRFLALLVVVAAAGVAASETPAPTPAVKGEALARQFCTSCHAFPPPDILPRAKWGPEIFEMTGLALTRTGAPKGKEIPLDVPMESIVAYYEAKAPRELPPPASWPEPSNAPVPFARHALRLSSAELPIVANVRLLTLDPARGLEVFAADMQNGLILRGSPSGPEAGLAVVRGIPNPCHTQAVDLDKDGLTDLIVADLGSVTPGDQTHGGVVWLRGRADGGFDAKRLASDLPRVADVEAADFDGDGDLDLVVAAFGWREVGSTLLLENRTTDWASPVFVPRELDWRQGAIHVPVVDLDKDGRPDFVALLSQHHETVVAFLNQGWAPSRPTSTRRPIRAGALGLELTDLDGDGDVDVLWRTATCSTSSCSSHTTASVAREPRDASRSPRTRSPGSPGCTARRQRTSTATGTWTSWPAPIPGMAKYGGRCPRWCGSSRSPRRVRTAHPREGGYHATWTWRTSTGTATWTSSPAASRWTTSAPNLGRSVGERDAEEEVRPQWRVGGRASPGWGFGPAAGMPLVTADPRRCGRRTAREHHARVRTVGPTVPQDARNRAEAPAARGSETRPHAVNPVLPVMVQVSPWRFEMLALGAATVTLQAGGRRCCCLRAN